MKKIILTIIALLLFDAVGFACSCKFSTDAHEALGSSFAVFSGKVIDVRMNVDSADILTEVEAIMDVQRVWKGVVKSRISVFTSSCMLSCGYAFYKGGEYLVYASTNQEGKLITSICSRTGSLRDAWEDMKELGEGKPVGRERGN